MMALGAATGHGPGDAAPAPDLKMAAREREVQPTKLFIGGISRRTTTKQLRDHFSKCGRVLDCVAMRQPDGRPRGFGYVTLDSPAAAEHFLREPQLIDDRFVDLKPAVPDAAAGGGQPAGGGGPAAGKAHPAGKLVGAPGAKPPTGQPLAVPPGLPQHPPAPAPQQQPAAAWPAEMGMFFHPGPTLATMTGVGLASLVTNMVGGCNAVANDRAAALTTPQCAGGPRGAQPQAPPVAAAGVAARAPTRTLLPQPRGAAKPWEDVYIDEFFARKSSEDRRAWPAAARAPAFGEEAPHTLLLAEAAGPDLAAAPLGEAAAQEEEAAPELEGQAAPAHAQRPRPEMMLLEGDGTESSGSFKSSEEEEEDGASFIQDRWQPSAGSAKHSIGECRRCNFFAKGRCWNGVDCPFCHLPHDRRKLSRQEKREAQAARAMAQQQGEDGVEPDEALTPQHGGAAAVPPEPRTPSCPVDPAQGALAPTPSPPPAAALAQAAPTRLPPGLLPPGLPPPPSAVATATSASPKQRAPLPAAPPPPAPAAAAANPPTPSAAAAAAPPAPHKRDQASPTGVVRVQPHWAPGAAAHRLLATSPPPPSWAAAPSAAASGAEESAEAGGAPGAPGGVTAGGLALAEAAVQASVRGVAAATQTEWPMGACPCCSSRGAGPAPAS